MRIKIMLLIIIVSITGASCSFFQSKSDNVDDFLPRETDVPGWVMKNPVQSYTGANIKKYKQDYAGIGIERLSSSVYESIDNPDIKIKIEVVRFDSVLSAYGFYSVTRGHGIFDIGETNDFSSDKLCLIRMGDYVVYSSTDSEYPAMKEELMTFSKIPFNYIGENYMNYKLPGSLNILKGADGYGIIYSINKHEKFLSLERIAYTQWKWNNNLIKVFYSEYRSFYDAYEVFKENIVDNYIVSSSDEIYTAFKKEDNGKYIFISVRDNCIFGGWSIEEYNDMNKIHNEILNRIDDYNKRNIK